MKVCKIQHLKSCQSFSVLNVERFSVSQWFIRKKSVNLYGVLGQKKFMGREYMGTFRTSFLVDDPKGKIVKVYENVKPPLHAEEVLRDLGDFAKNSAEVRDKE